MEPFKQFVSPHCHPQSLDSASTPEMFAKRELELGTGAITATDHGTLVAAYKIYELAKKHELIPIIGLESYFRDPNDPLLPPGDPKTHWKYGHLTMHYMDQAAFHTGVRLLSKAPLEKHGSESKPLFGWNEVEELAAQNVTMGSSCLIGVVARHLLDHNDPQLAEKYYQRLRGLAKPGHFIVELFPHDCSRNYVNGIFVTVNQGDKRTELKYNKTKWLKTNAGEIRAEDLAKEFKKKDNPHTTLLAVKNYRVWEDLQPVQIIETNHVAGFLPNECRDWCPDGDVQLGVNEFIYGLSQKYGDPVLISDDSHFAYPGPEQIVQNVRLAQAGWQTQMSSSYHRQASEEAWQYFSNRMGIDRKTFESWIDNSRAWAAKFKDFKLEAKPALPSQFFEKRYADLGAANSLEYTMKLIEKHGRMDWNNPAYVARLKEEIKLFYKNGTIDLLPYFMIAEATCDLYTQNSQLTGVGRGSAAGCLLSYLLGVVHVDPIRYRLSLDRFLTLDRIKSNKYPDIDQDLPNRDLLVGDEENVGWLQKEFGDHVAQVSTITSLKLKSAILDVARFTYKDVVPKAIAKLAHQMEVAPQGLDDSKFVFGYEDSGNFVGGSITRDPALQEYIKKYPDQWEIVQKCLGLARQSGRHASAYAFGARPLHEFIPLTQIGGVTCTQFTAAAVEAAGALKMDYLCLNSLSDLSKAIKIIQDKTGTELSSVGMTIDGKMVPNFRLVPTQEGLKDVWDLPLDPAVFSDIAEGKTETVFQLNTPGALKWLRYFDYAKADGTPILNSVEAMAVFTALDRPGPLDALVTNPDSESRHNMLVEYTRRARGQKPSSDIPAIFDKLLPETYGIMCFQEQLQRVYQQLTDCTGSEAEEFRGYVAKKKKEKILELYKNFIEKATPKLGSKEIADTVWSYFNTCANYLFNLSHATCYSVIGYACAYLKHYYPLAWWCAVLQNADKNEIAEKFWKYCSHLIDFPNVTKACSNFEIVGKRIQAPLSLIHGVGETAHKQLLATAPYHSIDDMVQKIDQWKMDRATAKDGKSVLGRSAINEGIIYKLIISGAMDSVFPEGSSTISMLEAYEWAAFRQEQVRRVRNGKKPSKKQTPKGVREGYGDLTQYTRYQRRKEILPMFSDSVFRMLQERGHDSLNDKGWVIRNSTYPFISGRQLQRYVDEEIAMPQDGVIRACAAYIEDVRTWTFMKADGTSSACELSIDVDGHKFKFIKWAGKAGKLSSIYSGDLLKGSLAVVIVNKYSQSRPFTVDHIEVIQLPSSQVIAEDKEESA